MVVQWLRIHLAMQGTLVWSLVQGDPTCLGAAKPGRAPLTTELTYSNYWSLCALQLMLSNKRSHHNGKPNTATKNSACSLQLEKAHVRWRRPTTANKQIKKKSVMERNLGSQRQVLCNHVITHFRMEKTTWWFLRSYFFSSFRPAWRLGRDIGLKFIYLNFKLLML